MESLDPIFCPDTDEALSFIDYELPEIKVLDFSSEEIENRKDPNILIVQTVYNFKQNFSRLLKVLWSNQQFRQNRKTLQLSATIAELKAQLGD